MSCRLRTGVLVAVFLASWTPASPARAANAALSWVNHLGSDGDDAFGDLACDPQSGDVFITGNSPNNSQDLPSPGFPRSGAGIVTARFSMEGVFGKGSFLNGNGKDGIRAIAWRKDKLFIAGFSSSNNFGSVRFASRIGTVSSGQKGFVAQVDPQTLVARWVYLLDVDTNGAEIIQDLVILEDGSLVVAGAVDSTAQELEQPDALEPPAPTTDAFVVQLLISPSSATDTPPFVAEKWVFRLPDSGRAMADAALALALDAKEDIYVAGRAVDIRFAVSPDGRFHQDGLKEDGFILKLERDGTQKVGTYFGGFGHDAVNDLIIQGNELFVVGTSASVDLPGGRSSGDGQHSRAFAAKFDKDSMKHLGTVLLGSGLAANDEGRSVALADNQLYVGGIARSSDFPGTALSHQVQRSEGFVARVDLGSPTPSILSSVLVGGRGDDAVLGLGGASFEKRAVLCVGGHTSSNLKPPDGPATDPFQPLGGQDLFLGRLDVGPPVSAPDGGTPGDMDGGGSEDGGSVTDGGLDGGAAPRPPLGYACGASTAGGGSGALALGALLGLALLAVARRGRLPPHG